MRKIIKQSVMLLLACISFLCSCRQSSILDVREEKQHRIIDIKEPLKNLGYWEVSEIEGEANSVILELTREDDLLFWTRENGEVIDIQRKDFYTNENSNYKVTNKQTKQSFFLFPKPGTYILNIYQKPNENEMFNIEDLDFRGKVKVGPHAVKIQDTGYAQKCRKQAQYIIKNISNSYSDGNIMTELVFAEALGREWDYKRRCNYAVYKALYKYSGIDLEPGESKIMLLPIGTSVNDTRLGFAILKPVIQDGDTFYYIQTTNLVLNNINNTEIKARRSKQGTMGSQHNGVLTYVNNERFEMPW